MGGRPDRGRHTAGGVTTRRIDCPNAGGHHWEPGDVALDQLTALAGFEHVDERCPFCAGALQRVTYPCAPETGRVVTAHAGAECPGHAVIELVPAGYKWFICERCSFGVSRRPG